MNLVHAFGKFGGFALARFITQSQPKILMYHRFSMVPNGHDAQAGKFEQHLDWMQKHNQLMSLADVVQYKIKHGKFPTNAIVITVDDGYRDFYEVAFPILKRRGIPATFYVTTGFVNGDIWLWPDQIQWLLSQEHNYKGPYAVGDTVFSIEPERSEVWWPIVLQMLRVKNQDRIDCIHKLQESLGVKLPIIPPARYAPCNWDQLKEMQSAGIEIGGHSVTHPSLGSLEPIDARHEIQQSFDTLNEKLGVRPRTFCYPNGQPSDYSEEIKRYTKEVGYLAAVTAFSDCHGLSKDFAWRRFVGGNNDFQQNKSISGMELLGNKLKRNSRCGY